MSAVCGTTWVAADFRGADLRGADLGEPTLQEAGALRGASIGPGQAGTLLAALGLTVLT